MVLVLSGSVEAVEAAVVCLGSGDAVLVHSESVEVVEVVMVC